MPNLCNETPDLCNETVNMRFVTDTQTPTFLLKRWVFVYKYTIISNYLSIRKKYLSDL